MDPRDREATEGRWFDRFNESAMTLYWTTTTVCKLCETGEDDGSECECGEHEVAFPARFAVCGLCDGRGAHVNPSIDAHGITAEEFYDDPDFAEEYHRGTYDVPCYRCHGKRVEPVIDESNLDPEQKANLKRLHECQRDMAEYYAECAAERRMGA